MQLGRPNKHSARNNHPFGEKLKRLLEEKGLKQEELAEKSHMHSSVISRMVKGDRLSGSAARSNLLRIIKSLYELGAIHSIAEANALLTSIPKVKELDERDEEDLDVLKLLRTEEQEISPPAQAKQEQLGSRENALAQAKQEGYDSTENTREKAPIQRHHHPHEATSSAASAQMLDGAYILGPVINQGAVNFFGSNVGSISGAGGNVIRTSPHSERGQMLRRLRHNYCSRLDQLHQRTVNLELRFTKLPDANWSGTISRVFHAECQMKEGTPISSVYEDAVRELLILGEAGAGKTTLLLTLGQYLIDQAEQDEMCPIPVILSLSTWAMKSLELKDWIREQLVQIYKVPHQQSKQWVQQKQILPLLDGLDEVEFEDRAVCIAAINRYYREHLRPLVVSCRTAAYRAATMRERLYLHAVMVQSLTPEQVDEGLDRAGEQFAALKEVFNQQVSLQNLVRVPLMLRFLIGINPEIIVQELSQRGMSLESQIRELYIQELLKNQGHSGAPRLPSHYTAEQTRFSLTYLARKMRRHKQSIFYLEHLQSDWLPTKRFSRCYKQLATRGVGILLGWLLGLSVNAVIFGGNLLSFDMLYGLLGGLIGGLIAGDDTPGFHFAPIRNTLKHQWRPLVLSGLRNGFLVGTLVSLAFFIWPSGGSHEDLIYGCGMGVCSFWLTLLVLAGKGTDAQKNLPSTFNQRLWNGIVPQGLKTDHCKLGILIGLILGLCVGVSVGLSTKLSNGYGMSVGLNAGFSNGLSTGLTIGFSFTGIGIILCLLLLGKKSTILVKDELEWTYKGFRSQLTSKNHLSITFRLFLFIMCTFGLGVGTGIGVSTGWSAGISAGMKFGLSAGLSVSSAYWILFGLWTAVSSKTLNDDVRMIPNEGIRRSLHNALQIGLWGGVLSILIGGSNEILYYGLYHGFSSGFHEGILALWRDGIFIECFGALLPALLMGGITVLCHYLLRLLLWCASVLPLHTIRFLEDATTRDLLHKDGGGYRFSHGDIFDYFTQQKLRNAGVAQGTSKDVLELC